jgi:hypothetical protein
VFFAPALFKNVPLDELALGINSEFGLPRPGLQPTVDSLRARRAWSFRFRRLKGLTMAKKSATKKAPAKTKPVAKAKGKR